MRIGFAADEVRTDQTTRQARLKWVIVVDDSLPPGAMVNAAACTAAVVGRDVAGLLGAGGPDASGVVHPGLPWAGCTVLRADAGTIRAVRAKAAARDDVLVADMPALAQTTRVYDEYLAKLAATRGEDVSLLAVSIVGPRNAVGKLVDSLVLL